MALFYFCSENGTSGESNQIPPLNADREVVRTHTPLFLYIYEWVQTRLYQHNQKITHI